MSNKGKKKQGKVMSLSEFHAATESSSSGGGGASLGGGGGGGIGVVPASVGQTVRINWADEMEKLDDSAPTDFVFDRSKLPTAAKSNLAPDFDLESVPKQPPFTAFISNVSFEADETKIRGFFRDSNILNVRLPLDERGRFKGQGYIDFADRESLITALQRNEESFFNRAMKVVLESKSRHYGGRGGANDTGERASDEADWRSRPAPRDQESSGGPHKSFSFHNDPMRQGGGNPRYQNREGGGQGGGGYQRRNNYNNSNYNNNRGGDGQNAWQHSNNRSGGGEYHQGDRPPRRNNYQKFEGGHQRRNEGEQREHRESGGEQEKQQPTSTPTSPPEGPSERPKLKLAPRTLPVAEEPDAQASASAIFGSARPVNTAARERMIEEKLQREREAKAKADAAAAAAAADADVDAEATPEAESDAPVPPVAEQLPTSPPQQQQHGGNRSHKTSVSSDHKDSAGEFHTVGGHQTHYGGGRGGGRGGGDRRPYKNEGGRGDRDGNRQQRLTPSESFTSGGNKYQNTRQPYHNKPRGGEHSGGGGGHYQQHDRVHRGHDESSSGASGQHQRSTENPWKTKSSAADLFSGSNAGATNTVGDSPSSNRGSARTSESHPAAEQDSERSPASHQQHQRRVNTNTNNNNRLDRKPHGSGDFQNSRGGPRGDNNNRRGNYNNNNRGGGKQLGRQGGGGERDNKVSEKREYQPRPPRDFASVAAAPQTKQETGLNNKFAGLAIDVEDVDYDNDNDDEEEEEDEELEHEDDEQHQKEQHVDA